MLAGSVTGDKLSEFLLLVSTGLKKMAPSVAAGAVSQSHLKNAKKAVMDLFVMQGILFKKQLAAANGGDLPSKELLLGRARDRLQVHKKGLNSSRRDNYQRRGRALIGEFLDTQQYGKIAEWGMAESQGKPSTMTEYTRLGKPSL